jgi:AbrB family looped-hinge helix DNA binding protein
MANMEIRTQLSENGRLIIPAKFRKALKLKAGDEIVIRIENGTLRMIPLHQAVSLAQENVKMYAPKGVSLVDTLLQERRKEAKRG